MSQFKIRCSALGEIMAGNVGMSEAKLEELKKLEFRHIDGKKPLTEKMEARRQDLLKEYSQPPELPQGAKSYCERWVKDQLFGSMPRENKYTRKGIHCEEEAIRMLGDYEKNEEFFENELMCGTPDLLVNNEVWDIKCSWDHYTFPLFDSAFNHFYWWQLQGYMELTGASKAKLIYCLVDYPENDFSYAEVDTELRTKTYEIERENIYARVEERVEMCRKYIETLGFTKYGSHI